MLAIPIIDELLNKVFSGMHFLEPIIDFESEMKVKTVLIKPKTNFKAANAQHQIDSELYQHKFGVGGKIRLAKINTNTKIKLPPSMRLILDDLLEGNAEEPEEGE